MRIADCSLSGSAIHEYPESVTQVFIGFDRSSLHDMIDHKMAPSTGWILLVVLASLYEVQSRSGGPPLSSGTFDLICNQQMPSHGGNSAQSGNGGYVITTDIPRSGSTGYGYTAGRTYTGKLTQHK